MNTLVTKCRHPGIVVLIWSLPFLQLLKRVDCDTDLTCFTRMVRIHLDYLIYYHASDLQHYFTFSS